MKKILVFVLIWTSSLFCQEAGKTGLSFLKFGFGARNMALGNSGMGASGDVTALYYNPAMLTGMEKSELMFTHNEWIQDVRSEMFGAGFKLFGLPLAVGINTTSVSDIEVRNNPGEPESKFNANYFSGSLSTGFHLMDELSFGMTIKYLYENLLSDDASGTGYDLGLFYTSPVEGLSFGAAVRNMGSMNILRKESTKLPTDVNFAGIYTFANEVVKSDISLIAGVQKYTNTEDLHVNLGVEAFYDGLIALRAGYQSGFESRGITTGLGLNWKSLNFDYAFVPFSLDLGSTHILSIKLEI